MNLIYQLLLLSFFCSLLGGCTQITKPEQAVSLTVEFLLDGIPASAQADKIAQSKKVIQARLDEMSSWPTEIQPGSESLTQLSLLFFGKTDIPMEFVREVVQQRGSLWITSTYSRDQIFPLLSDSILRFIHPASYQTQPTSPLIGMVMGYDTMDMRHALAEEQAQGLLPPELQLTFGSQEILLEGQSWVECLAIQHGPGNIKLDATSLIENVAEKSQYGDWVISMGMNETTAKAWEKMTAAHVNRHLAFVLDGQVVSYPVVNEPITGGRTQLSGKFSETEAKRLAILFRHESLPLAVRIRKEEVVSLSE